MTRRRVVALVSVVVSLVGGAALAASVSVQSQRLTALPVINQAAPTTTAGPATNTCTLTPVADSWVQQDAAGTNFGGQPTLRVRSGDGPQNRRSFVRFNLAACSPTLPSDTTKISAATFSLWLVTSPGSTRDHELARVGSAWTESAITWTNQPSSVVVSGTAKTNIPTTPGAVSYNVLTDVRAWASGTANNGWRIKDEAENANNQVREATYTSRECAAATTPACPSNELPKLVITYVP